LIREHCDTTAIDADRRLNLYGMQRLGFRSIVEAGEMLWLERTRLPRDNLPLNFQVQMLEPEHLDDRHTGLLANGNDEYDGIEFDLLGRRVNYRLFREHPEGYLQRFPESRKVAAGSVIHAYEVERAGQRRGVPWLAPVMSLLQDGHDYMDAQLLKQKLAAMFVAFTRDADPDGADVGVAGATDGDTELFPGMFEHLPPGRDVTFSDPPRVDGYEGHMALVLRMIASGRSLTYEALSGDLSGANFSSARMGRMEMNRAMASHQWLTVIPQVCQPFERWMRERLADRIGEGREYRIKWTPPRPLVTDPVRETTAMLKEIDGGLSSRSHKIRELGYDPEEVDRERADDMARERKLSLTEQEAANGGGNG
jgi:lambda family phage portal protein